MGAYCSVTNNTPSSTMYIKYGPDPTALRLAGAASGLFGSLLPLASYLGVSCSSQTPPLSQTASLVRPSPLSR